MLRAALLIALALQAPQALQAPVSNPTRASACDRARGTSLTKAEFEIVMHEIALGWNQNDARRAAACFTPDAIYSAMPSPNMRVGRDALYRWFGGEAGRPKPMQMEWHHLIFDADQQLGVGEYTFKYEVQTHGLVIIKMKNGLVSNWREYEIESPRAWKELIGANAF